MDATFYVAAVVAILATAMTITRLNAVHALLYLIVSLLAVAIVFYAVGAPFIAALEVIIYAGAIMVLFIFVVMMLNLGQRTIVIEKQWLRPGMWTGPAILAIVLVAELVYSLVHSSAAALPEGAISAKEVGMALYQPYLIGVELASFLLMGGLVGAYHLGVRRTRNQEEQHGTHSHELRTVAGGDPFCTGPDRPSRAS